MTFTTSAGLTQVVYRALRRGDRTIAQRHEGFVARRKAMVKIRARDDVLRLALQPCRFSELSLE
jgi:hypothetical protein